MIKRVVDFDTDEYRSVVAEFKEAIARGDVCTLSTGEVQGEMDVIFTAGMTNKGLPELVLFNCGVDANGYSPETMIDTFTHYVDHLIRKHEKGEPLTDEKGVDWTFLTNGNMEGAPCPLQHVQVDPEAACVLWMMELKDTLGHMPLQVIQLLTPDPTNKLPGEDGFDPEYGPRVTLPLLQPATTTN